MRLTVHEFMTIDGVVQGPGSPDEDRSGGFELGGWTVPMFDDATGEIVTSWFERTEALLYGRRTYRLMADFWPQVTDPADLVARQLNTLPKYVASRTLTGVDWQNSTLLEGDAMEAVRELKARPGGELQVHGCRGLVQDLQRAGLVDEYRILTFPVVLGTGLRLFGEGVPATGFTVTDHRVTPAGVTYTALTPAPLGAGSFTVVDGKDVVAVP